MGDGRRRSFSTISAHGRALKQDELIVEIVVALELSTISAHGRALKLLNNVYCCIYIDLSTISAHGRALKRVDGLGFALIFVFQQFRLTVEH